MTGLLRGLLLATAVLFWGEVMILAAARSGYQDPFAPFLAMMPGQPVEVIEDYPCQPPLFLQTSSTESGFCAFTDEGSVFQQVVVIDSNHLIARVVFVVQSNALSVGDLVVCWGQPIYTLDNSTPYTNDFATEIYWDNQVRAHILPHHSISEMGYFLPVAAISFERQWREVDSEKLGCAAGH